MKAEEPAAAFAIRRYEERLARDPGSLVFAPLADAHRKAGRPEEAIRLCREGLERFPDYATARLILAKALADGGEPETALAEVRVILQGNPADAQAHRLAGELERRAGRLPESAGASASGRGAGTQPTGSPRLLVEVLDGGARSPEAPRSRVSWRTTRSRPSASGRCVSSRGWWTRRRRSFCASSGRSPAMTWPA